MGAHYIAEKDGPVKIKLRNYYTGKIIGELIATVKEGEEFNIDVEGVIS